MDNFKNLPENPLWVYRKQANFDCRILKSIIYGEDRLRFMSSIWKFLSTKSIFEKSPQTLPIDELRRITQKRLRVFNAANLYKHSDILRNARLPAAYIDSAIMYDINMTGKYEINYILFPNVIRRLGTSKHQKYLEALSKNEITGCFALTEVSHGSNVMGIQTTATYDPIKKLFIMNTPSFESAKCWAGNLGKVATHAIVFARLITSNKDRGINAFLIPIRCSKSLKPYPGVIVGDLGEKIALNGVDNGFLIFDSYEVSVECLLNKYGDVDKLGNFTSCISDPKRRVAEMIGVLSTGRIQITQMASNYLLKAVTVAIRYSAVRKQFGLKQHTENPILEYQQQQFRMLPYLSAVYATKIFSFWLSEINTAYVSGIYKESFNKDRLKAVEIHAVSCASKPSVSWLARDGIQVCREACGGHGYLKAAGIGDWRNENDANCTYEGENSVLIQQTSNWLIGLWRKVCNGENVLTPYGNAEFLNHYKSIPSHIKITSTKDAMNPEVILTAYKWLICYYLSLITDKINKLSQLGKDTFTIRNDTQSYHAASLSVIFAEYIILDKFYKFCVKVEDKNCSVVLMKLVSLYGLWSLEKHLGSLYMGKFLSEDAGQYIRDAVLELCLDIKPEAVALVDTLAPPDFILNSVLGCSDGRVYQNLKTSIFTSPDTFSRPSWWKEIINFDECNLFSKL